MIVVWFHTGWSRLVGPLKKLSKLYYEFKSTLLLNNFNTLLVYIIVVMNSLMLYIILTNFSYKHVR